MKIVWDVPSGTVTDALNAIALNNRLTWQSDGSSIVFTRLGTKARLGVNEGSDPAKSLSDGESIIQSPVSVIFKIEAVQIPKAIAIVTPVEPTPVRVTYSSVDQGADPIAIHEIEQNTN
jgi:hypothetical protein